MIGYNVVRRFFVRPISASLFMNEQQSNCPDWNMRTHLLSIIITKQALWGIKKTHHIVNNRLQSVLSFCTHDATRTWTLVQRAPKLFICRDDIDIMLGKYLKSITILEKCAFNSVYSPGTRLGEFGYLIILYSKILETSFAVLTSETICRCNLVQMQDGDRKTDQTGRSSMQTSF